MIPNMGQSGITVLAAVAVTLFLSTGPVEAQCMGGGAVRVGPRPTPMLAAQQQYAVMAALQQQQQYALLTALQQQQQYALMVALQQQQQYALLAAQQQADAQLRSAQQSGR